MMGQREGVWAQRRLVLATIIALFSAAGGAVWFSWHSRSGLAPDTINPGDPVQVALGRRVYADQCAQCHGTKLEGQPNWRSRRPDGRLPAPPHDVSGHTWHHGDAVLFRITREGISAVVGGGYESDMPGFRGVLSDAEIRAALAFIKSTWPDRERGLQERQSHFERQPP